MEATKTTNGVGRVVLMDVDHNIPWFSYNGKYYVHPDYLSDFLLEVGPLLE